MSLRLIANWKLNGSKEFNQRWISNFFKYFNDKDFSLLGIAPPSIYLDHLRDLLGKNNVCLGAQNIDEEDSGARTGEISASMIKDLGCEFTIVGHSERRTLFYESNQAISKKLIQANRYSLVPILCIGESAQEYQDNVAHEILHQQILEALKDSIETTSLIIAYEPVWAIGSGQTPTPEEINSVHEMIKDVVQSRFPKIDLASVLYGGSVSIANAASLFEQKNIDGALIGGASLDGKEFASIANVFNKIKVK
tara:strand:+ start:464 stop:1219 length:756 start_codon:yes stop_codon:yes gene_type:complete